MKKIFVIACLLFLTGCANDFVCTKEIEDDMYKTKEKMIFEFDKNDKLTNVSASYTMIFETEEDAKKYSAVFKTLEENYDIELKGKEIIVSTDKNYELYDGDRIELEKSLEKDGYSCK